MELAGFSNTVTNVFLLIARPLQEKETITSLLFFLNDDVAELEPSKKRCFRIRIRLVRLIYTLKPLLISARVQIRTSIQKPS
jgi:hypothetical protein